MKLRKFWAVGGGGGAGSAPPLGPPLTSVRKVENFHEHVFSTVQYIDNHPLSSLSYVKFSQVLVKLVKLCGKRKYF